MHMQRLEKDSKRSKGDRETDRDRETERQRDRDQSSDLISAVASGDRFDLRAWRSVPGSDCRFLSRLLGARASVRGMTFSERARDRVRRGGEEEWS